MEGNSEPPPFWIQSQKVSFFSRPPSHTSSSSWIRPWILVLLASVFVVLFIPSFLSSNLRGFRPSMVKNGWDTLNLALVVFAILCGLLGRDVASSSGGSSDDGEKLPEPSPPPPLQSQEWVAYSPAPEQNVFKANRSVGMQRMRNSNSYPDLRQEFHAGDDWEITADWRFADDIQLFRRWRPDITELGSFDEPVAQSIKVDSNEVRKSTSRPLSHPETPPSPPRIPAAVPATPPPPPPPPPPMFPKQKLKSQRKRSGAAAKDIATAIALFYSKKKRRSKAKKIHDSESLPPASQLIPPPPPPPPPPPLSSVFSQIFTHRKGGSKSKKFNSVPTNLSSPPPPPPPPTFGRSKQKGSLISDSPLSTSLPIHPPSAAPPPPPPPPSTPPLAPRKRKQKTLIIQHTYPIAPPSPLPPPPPPPPPLSGDDNDDCPKFAREETASRFLPSPDVNNKADLFITRFREGLKLEKLNSIREKQRRHQDPPQEQRQEVGIESEMEQEIMTIMMMGLGGLSDE